MSVRIDDSRHPLVVVQFVGASTDAEFDAYLEQMHQIVLARKQKNVTIFDATRSTDTNAQQRRKQADWLKAHAGLLRTYSLGSAFVITSPLVRGVLTAILWLQPMPAPHTVVGTYAEGERWAIEKLREAGLSPGGTSSVAGP